MSDEPVHPAVSELDETELAPWLAAFFDAPASLAAPYGYRVPLLRAGESPYTWLRDQFRRVQGRRGLPGKIRRSVVEVIRSTAARGPVEAPQQVLGLLLEVAGSCGFSEISEILRGWVQNDFYRTETYRLQRQEITLRRIAWNLLIAWHKTEGLEDELSRDLERPDLDCEALCFGELGRLDSQQAIARIPKLLELPEPYWREALWNFLSTLGAEQAVTANYREGWGECFAAIVWDTVRADHLQEESSFKEVLGEAGIRCWVEHTVVHLRVVGSGVKGLDLDVDLYRHRASEEIARQINEAFRSDKTGPSS